MKLLGRWAIFLAIVWMLGFLVAPLLRTGHEPQPQVHALFNMKLVGLAALMYAQDNDERFPPSEHWYITLAPYLVGSSPLSGKTIGYILYSPDREPELFEPDIRLLETEVATKDRRSIAMNKALSMRKEDSLREPSLTVLFAEAHYRYHQQYPWSPRQNFWVPETLDAPDRGITDTALGWKQLGKPGAIRWNGGSNYGFTDGHARWHRPEQIYSVVNPGGKKDSSFVPQ